MSNKKKCKRCKGWFKDLEGHMERMHTEGSAVAEPGVKTPEDGSTPNSELPAPPEPKTEGGLMDKVKGVFSGKSESESDGQGDEDTKPEPFEIKLGDVYSGSEQINNVVVGSDADFVYIFRTKQMKLAMREPFHTLREQAVSVNAKIAMHNVERGHWKYVDNIAESWDIVGGGAG